VWKQLNETRRTQGSVRRFSHFHPIRIVFLTIWLDIITEWREMTLENPLTATENRAE